MPKVRYPPSPYAISHRAFLKVDSDATLAQRREEKKHARASSSSSSIAPFVAPSCPTITSLDSTPKQLIENPMVHAW